MDRVLVAYASKRGATKEIAERIGQVLRDAGLQVDLLPAGKVRDPAPYGAVVLGSAVYIFHWRKEAARLLKALAALPKRRVWLFSSGPTSETDTEAFPEGLKLPKGLQPVADRMGVRDAAVFRGSYDPARSSGLERWMMTKVKAPSGDYRQWDVIEAWARAIAESLVGGGA